MTRFVISFDFPFNFQAKLTIFAILQRKPSASFDEVFKLSRKQARTCPPIQMYANSSSGFFHPNICPCSARFCPQGGRPQELDYANRMWLQMGFHLPQAPETLSRQIFCHVSVQHTLTDIFHTHTIDGWSFRTDTKASLLHHDPKRSPDL